MKPWIFGGLVASGIAITAPDSFSFGFAALHGAVTLLSFLFGFAIVIGGRRRPERSRFGVGILLGAAVGFGIAHAWTGEQVREAERRGDAIGLEIERFRESTGRWPRDLGELEAVPSNAIGVTGLGLFLESPRYQLQSTPDGGYQLCFPSHLFGRVCRGASGEWVTLD